MSSMDDMAMSFSEQATCRICRSEGTSEEPLFHPCRCSGSIRNVHQECLVEWLSHSQKKHCELCKTPFRFTKLYDAHMPEDLPWRVFVTRAIWDTWTTLFSIARVVLVAWVWLIVLPWTIRWIWRWMFWFADAGWARDEHLQRLHNVERPVIDTAPESWTNLVLKTLSERSGNSTMTQLAFGALGSVFLSATDISHPSWKQPDSSIFSSFSYLAELTPYEPLNRIILDIFEGQLITCAVIISFILVFLIREWVVQQQPLVNVEPIAPARPVAPEEERFRAVANRIADLRADIEADLENLQTLQDRMQAQRRDIHDRRPDMPDRDVASQATRIRTEFEEKEVLNEHSTTPTSIVDQQPITNAGVDARLNMKWRDDTTPIAVKAPSSGCAEEKSVDSAVQSQDDIEDADDNWSDIIPESLLDAISDAVEPGEQYPPHQEVQDDVQVQYEAEDELAEEQPRLPAKRTFFDDLADMFWQGIEVPANLDDQVIVIDEQRVGLGNEAPFVPIHHDHDHDAEVDPEVAAAAQQAGLDPDGEGAEEMEGLLELIGLRGPLVGMAQTSLFCLLLVAATVLLAVVVPYVWGKFVLNLIGHPVYFLLVVPLRAMSFLADFIVDSTLFFGGWILTVSAVATEALLASISTFWPRIAGMGNLVSKASNIALREAGASGDRLHSMFAPGNYNFNTHVLGASARSHMALRELLTEADTVLNGTSVIAQNTIRLALSGDVATLWSGVSNLLARSPAVFASSKSGILAISRQLRTGNIALPLPESSLDPELIYWNSVDRSLAVSAGYLALAALATVYVASNTYVTTTASGKRIEKVIRDSLCQAGGVLKVILIISIEMLVFPFYCGLLLDVAFLPVFGNTVAARLTLAASRPYVFCFVHWFLGTYYMFHFALFVGMCRKILRRGVLWFIRDPDDPTFHPVRDVLERNVLTQLRKIAFSALVYGALVILCLGGVIWSIGRIFNGIFPLIWKDTEPTLEFPVDLFLYNFLTPLVIAFVRPSDGLEAAYAWWLRRCARLLRLSHFLFGERMMDEEGQYKQTTWRFDVTDGTVKGDFVSDGRYVFTPCHDQYRPPKPNETFFESANGDVSIVDQDGTPNPHWSKVYLPPHFKARVMLFMVCLWIFSAFAGLCVTLLPLSFGRRVLNNMLPGVLVNDIYAYSIGIYALGGALYLVSKARKLAVSWDSSIVSRVASCTYVYGYTFVVQPLIIAGIIESYVLVPMHTFLGLHVKRSAESGFLTSMMSAEYTIAKHEVHLAQDFALAILLLRLVLTSVTMLPRTRATEAVRRMTNAGLSRPDAWVATRYFIVPAFLLTTACLLLPAISSRIALVFLRQMYQVSPSFETILYRFSFPAFEGLLQVMLALLVIARATSRWRARIRDEVYLVGERLHNFGEKKPPTGTRSIMRKDRVVAQN